MNRWTSVLVPGVLVFSSACSSSEAARLGSLQDALPSIESLLGREPSPAQLSQLKGISFSSYYRGLLASTNDEPVAIGSQVLRGAHQSLLQAAPIFTKLDKNFKTLAAFRKTSALPLKQRLTKSQISATFNRLAQDYAAKSGWFARLATNKADVAALEAKASGVGFAQKDQRLVNLSALAAIAAANTAITAGLALITNSEATCNYPSVVQVVMADHYGADTYETCTATFTSSQTAITASHCNNGKQPYYKKANGDVVYGSYTKSNPRSSDISNVLPGQDQATIQFPPQPGQATSKVATTPVKAGDPVTIAGYGDSGMSAPGKGIADTSGTLRCGTNVIEDGALSDGMINLNGLLNTTAGYPPGEHSLSAPGDSGGPMFNAKGEIVGTDSSNAYNDVTTSASREYYSGNP